MPSFQCANGGLLGLLVSTSNDRIRLSRNIMAKNIESKSTFLFLKNGPTPASFSFIFGLFQKNNYNF